MHGRKLRSHDELIQPFTILPKNLSEHNICSGCIIAVHGYSLPGRVFVDLNVGLLVGQPIQASLTPRMHRFA